MNTDSTELDAAEVLARINKLDEETKVLKEERRTPRFLRPAYLGIYVTLFLGVSGYFLNYFKDQADAIVEHREIDLDFLEELLTSSDDNVGRSAAVQLTAYGETGIDRLRGALEDAQGSESWIVVQRIVYGLGFALSESAKKKAILLLRDSMQDSRLPEEGTWLEYGKISDGNVASLGPGTIRQVVFESLGRLGTEASVTVLSREWREYVPIEKRVGLETADFCVKQFNLARSVLDALAEAGGDTAKEKLALTAIAEIKHSDRRIPGSYLEPVFLQHLAVDALASLGAAAELRDIVARTIEPLTRLRAAERLFIDFPKDDAELWFHRIEQDLVQDKLPSDQRPVNPSLLQRMKLVYLGPTSLRRDESYSRLFNVRRASKKPILFRERALMLLLSARPTAACELRKKVADLDDLFAAVCTPGSTPGEGG